MANFNKARKMPYYWHKQPVQTPSFIDLDKYLPKSEDSNLSPFNRQYPKPVTLSTGNQKLKNDVHHQDRKNKYATITTPSSTTSTYQDTHKVNVTCEQRTISLSSGEEFYSSSGQDTARRPAKRRHHSVATVTPDFQDEVIEIKRVKRNYNAPQGKQTAKALKFKRFDVETPVFTLTTVSTCALYFAKL